MATIAILKEQGIDERRVALDPVTCKKLIAQGHALRIQSNAGSDAGFDDSAYSEIGANLYPDIATTLESAELLAWITPPPIELLAKLDKNLTIIGMMLPSQHDYLLDALQQGGQQVFAMELIPRITRAQSMDVLSSQATIAGYQAVLIAADLSPRLFPMLTTAAGTLRPAKAIVIGAGVAGLQAIATARRLGAQVEAYDIRSAAREQVQSLGARMIDTGVNAEGEGGYARELTADEKQQQADVLAEHLTHADVVISTAAIPGRPAPKIINDAMVEGMQTGSVIVDLAAETGGNCTLTKPGEIFIHQGVTLAGPLNLASRAPLHASEMYARNVFELIKLLADENGNITPNNEDEIIQGSLLSQAGKIVHPTYSNPKGE